MKKLLLTLTAVTAITFASQAQTEKGKIILGGQVGFAGESIKDTDVKTTGFSIIPQVGYFVADNIAIGTGVGYSWNKAEETKDNDQTVGKFVVSPYGRMYSKNDGPVKFFGQLTVPMAWGTAKVNDTKTATTADYGVELAPGIAYFPTSNIGIELKVRGLYYNNGSVKNETTDTKVTTNSYGLDANSLAPTLGVQFHF
ncbi:outer membrane beta-barrel protein [Sphingobacterium sp.]|uniref:outer membrane beta-barrel protein n=1 Tax=Sphingobacterium sp. TaxID=341027 RepID=UPI00289CF9B7|nr:outer membrane beta-barrel protein [Sphingobacterium sp.]